MSMETRELVVPAAFIINREAAIYINLGFAEAMNELPDELAGLPRKGQVKAVLGRPGNCYGMDEIDLAVEALEEYGVDASYASQFDGGITLTTDFDSPALEYSEDMEDDYIAWIAMERTPNFFRAAYRDSDEMVEEIREKLAQTGLFPDDFDYKAYMGAISGTYFA